MRWRIVSDLVTPSTLERASSAAIIVGGSLIHIVGGKIRIWREVASERGDKGRVGGTHFLQAQRNELSLRAAGRRLMFVKPHYPNLADHRGFTLEGGHLGNVNGVTIASPSRRSCGGIHGARPSHLNPVVALVTLEYAGARLGLGK